MQNSMTAAHSTWEHLNKLQVFNSGDTLDRNAPRTSGLKSFEVNEQNYRLFPTYLDHMQRSEGSSSISGNLQILGAIPSSSYVNRSSAFQPFFTPSCPYTWPLLGRHTVRDSLSVLPDQIRHNQMQFTNSSASQGAFQLESLSHRAQTSTAIADRRSVIAVDISGKEKSKTASRRRSSTDSHCSSSENPDSEIKRGNKPRRKRKPVEVKDEGYWKRREKNNLAAKKSRDARRRQELSTQNRATFLEIENTRLHLELSCLRQENRKLKRFLNVYVTE